MGSILSPVIDDDDDLDDEDNIDDHTGGRPAPVTKESYRWS